MIIHEGRRHWIAEGRWDFFISHATIDKEAVARPLADELKRLGRQVWYDETEITAGMDLAEAIAFGTQASLFGVLVVSDAFFGREWTESELKALSGKNLFIVLHGIDVQHLERMRPELAQRLWIPSDIGIPSVARQLVEATERLQIYPRSDVA